MNREIGDKIRENRQWVVMIQAATRENGELIHHPHGMLRFELPDSIDNTANNAARFYLQKMDHFSAIGRGQTINAADLPKGVIDLIPWVAIPWNQGKFPANRETYTKFGMYGSTK